MCNLCSEYLYVMLCYLCYAMVVCCTVSCPKNFSAQSDSVFLCIWQINTWTWTWYNTALTFLWSIAVEHKWLCEIRVGENKGSVKWSDCILMSLSPVDGVSGWKLGRSWECVSCNKFFMIYPTVRGVWSFRAWTGTILAGSIEYPPSDTIRLRNRSFLLKTLHLCGLSLTGKWHPAGLLSSLPCSFETQQVLNWGQMESCSSGVIMAVRSHLSASRKP